MAKTPIFEHVYISHRRKQRTYRVTDSNDVLENYALDLEGALGEKRGLQEPCSALTTRKVTGEELSAPACAQHHMNMYKAPSAFSENCDPGHQ